MKRGHSTVSPVNEVGPRACFLSGAASPSLTSRLRHGFPGDRPSIFAISSSRLSGGGSAFAFPGKTLRSGGGDEGGSGNLTLPFDALRASRRGFRSGGDSGRTGERAAAGGADGGSIGFGGRLNAASRRWAISARLFSSDWTARGGVAAGRFASVASPPTLPSPASGGGEGG